MSEYAIDASYRASLSQKPVIKANINTNSTPYPQIKADRSPFRGALERLLGAPVTLDVGRSYCPVDVSKTKVYYCERYKIVVFLTTDNVKFAVGQSGDEVYVVAIKTRNVETTALRCAIAVSHLLPTQAQQRILEASKVMMPRDRPLDVIITYYKIEDCWID